MSEGKISKISKTITDFLTVEDGNIAKESMMLTASVLVVTIAGQAILSQALADQPHSKHNFHFDWSKSG